VGGGALNSPTAPVSTTPSLLVYRLTFTPTGDKIDFYANPTPGAPLPATPTLTFNIPEDTFADTFTSIRMQSGEGAGTATPFSFDELRGDGSYANVTPTPEPGALGLLGLASLFALRRRRA
jgi:MYXO-CTERM domain-containing protein